ncbi:cell wall protein Gas5 [Schizosaccharomyces japonicus yFS275]|uniref:1,3-beta-glucanosyltransferase n=1 Tax=Schizosaccharomyces japonicus (strain yFS275 / FY16936) TaxID=402676 RepID=B6JV18_SCHJY|nr:cell wall protein Gas5 [Schizosaccharomyces japonicus yFS275]EEB05219.1 cell wall protein Gas5 [Schizosaccharomyces japonicus yFS275]
MKASTTFTFLLSLLAGFAVSQATNSTAEYPIVIKGNAFINSQTKERFYVRGVDYQPGGSSALVDPLADTTICKRDIPYLQALNVNTIRVYQVDNSANHDECMDALKEAGIYLILDLNTVKNSISRLDAASSYNAVYLQGIFATVDAFKGYDNVLGFFAGNEVANTVENAITTTWVKAALRDVKAYIKAQSDRQIPVGYSAADVAEFRVPCADFFACGDDDDRADFYGMNMYEWCGSSSMSVSGFDQRVKEFSNYTIPLILSEFGCNDVTKDSDGTPERPFTEIDAIFSTQMSSVFSGGLVYEYSEEGSNYGLVVVNGSTVTTSKNYDTLKEKFSSASSFSGDGGYNSTTGSLTCPANQTNWKSWSTLPSMPSKAEQFIKSGAGQPLGLNAPSNQLYAADSDALVSAGAHTTTTTLPSSVMDNTVAVSTPGSKSSSGSGSASTTGSSSASATGSASGSLSTVTASSAHSASSTSYSGSSSSSSVTSGVASNLVALPSVLAVALVSAIAAFLTL